MTHGRRIAFSPDDDALILAGRERGQSWLRIASLLGQSDECAVKRRAAELGLDPGRRVHHGRIAGTQVVGAGLAPTPDWTPARRAELRTLRLAGLTWPAIGARLGVKADCAKAYYRRTER